MAPELLNISLYLHVERRVSSWNWLHGSMMHVVPLPAVVYIIYTVTAGTSQKV